MVGRNRWTPFLGILSGKTQLTRKIQSCLYNDYTPLKMDTKAQRHPVASTMPTIELYSRKDIRFLHPGYASLNVLLRLPRVDRTSSGSFGVCHRTALLACQVIANNAFETGYLSQDKEGRQRVQVSPDGILTEEVYYLVVEGFAGTYM